MEENIYSLLDEIRDEVNRYKTAYLILMDYWEFLPDTDKPIITEKLEEVGL